MALWYLSFGGENGWLGGVFLEADHAIAAVERSHAIGVNPGGQVAIVRCDARKVRRYPRERLLSRAELEQLGPVVSEWS
jgi:hypothetical protein